jgi:acyl carrier protein
VSTRQAEFTEWLRIQLAQELELPAGSIDPAEPMATYGLDSVRAITLLAEVEEHLGFEIDPNALWEYPTVASFAQMVVGQMARTERS